ncbi:hypothetical protein [Sporanaerobium hydrogeniformans]|uniref:hypothetical protein n=1 Tax=Sporanaerobium hydrogeniformans TaxID=3072179 RepID=UPI0015D4C3F2|nr:hypothetical protein [Sporanaerobium hydrogeniformans]
MKTLDEVWQNSIKEEKALNKSKKQDDILHIAKQFVCYFEEVDRGEASGNSVKSS